MSKHIGIIAVSSEGAALCYRIICQEAQKLFGKLAYPEISLHATSLRRYLDFIERDDWAGVTSLLIASANKLAVIGADFAICPDNTVHRVFEPVVAHTRIPLISITETVARMCHVKDYQIVGVLGTKYTMQGKFYRENLSKFGIGMVIPNEDDQNLIHNIIFNELIPCGSTTSSFETEIIEVIQRLREMGCEAVILGCTELPLVISNDNSPLPVVDSTRLLAQRALKYSLASESIQQDALYQIW